eukprot:1131663-Rhodomonas_salina.1
MATNTRAELADMTSVLQDSDTDVPLTIYTDCMAVINMISRWQQGERQPLMEEESHPDIMTAAIHAETLIVWVKAHAGDPGNEQADTAAKAGALSERDAEWNIDTTPIKYCSNLTNSFPLLHEAKWTSTVEKHARHHLGCIQAVFLRQHLDAKSSDFILTAGNGQEILGE